MGALKSAISSACGLIIALPITDPQKFDISTLGGWGHMAGVLGIVVVISEARYFKQWSDGIKGE
jgi:hypothetical protein